MCSEWLVVPVCCAPWATRNAFGSSRHWSPSQRYRDFTYPTQNSWRRRLVSTWCARRSICRRETICASCPLVFRLAGSRPDTSQSSFSLGSHKLFSRLSLKGATLGTERRGLSTARPRDRYRPRKGCCCPTQATAAASALDVRRIRTHRTGAFRPSVRAVRLSARDRVRGLTRGLQVHRRHRWIASPLPALELNPHARCPPVGDVVATTHSGCGCTGPRLAHAGTRRGAYPGPLACACRTAGDPARSHQGTDNMMWLMPRSDPGAFTEYRRPHAGGVSTDDGRPLPWSPYPRLVML